MRTLLAILLASLPAAAQVPGGHVYFGVGGSWMVPLASDSGHVWKSAQQMKGFGNYRFTGVERRTKPRQLLNRPAARGKSRAGIRWPLHPGWRR